MKQMMDVAATETKAIAPDRLMGNELLIKRDGRLYYLLTNVVEDTAATALANVPEGSGFEYWRRVVKNCEPKTIGHNRTRLTALLNPNLTPDMPTEYKDRLETWEKMVQDYEKLKGTKMDEETLMGV